jgi:uncharacterized membrane protein YgcG
VRSPPGLTEDTAARKKEAAERAAAERAAEAEKEASEAAEREAASLAVAATYVQTRQRGIVARSLVAQIRREMKEAEEAAAAELSAKAASRADAEMSRVKARAARERLLTPPSPETIVRFAASPRREGEAPPEFGWITISSAVSGQAGSTVTKQMGKLPASVRQQQVAQWHRRYAIDSHRERAEARMRDEEVEVGRREMAQARVRQVKEPPKRVVNAIHGEVPERPAILWARRDVRSNQLQPLLSPTGRQSLHLGLGHNAPSLASLTASSPLSRPSTRRSRSAGKLRSAGDGGGARSPSSPGGGGSSGTGADGAAETGAPEGGAKGFHEQVEDEVEGSEEGSVARRAPGSPARGAALRLALPPNKLPRAAYLEELEMDPEGIGLAYGGMTPGPRSTRGAPTEHHTVHFSIGACGTYRLHVGLRSEALPLPGSPFDLQVVSGAAYALCTALAPLPPPLPATSISH